MPSHLSEMVSAECMIEQFVFMDGPEQVPIEERNVVGQLFRAQRFEVHFNSLGNSLLLWQRRLQSTEWAQGN